MKLIYLIIICALPLVTFSQNVNHSQSPEKMNKIVDKWVYGTIVFKNGNTIYSKISYNPLVPEGLLKIKRDNKIITATTFDVKSFNFYDSYNKKREYFTFPIDNKEVFMEFFFEGIEYMLLGRKSIQLNTYRDTGYKTTYINSIYLRYIYNKKTDTLYQLQGNSVFSIFEKHQRKSLKKFVRQNHIDVQSEDGLIELLKEYEKNSQLKI